MWGLNAEGPYRRVLAGTVLFRLLSMYPSAPRSSSPPHRAKRQPIPRAARREEANRDAISGGSRQYRGGQQSGQSEVPVQQGIGRRAQQEACRAEIGSMGSLGQIVRFTVQSVQIGAGRSGGQTGGDSLHQGLRHEVSLIPAWVRTSRATGAKNTSPPHRLMPS